MWRISTLLLVICLLAPGAVWGADEKQDARAAYIRANYTKTEHRVPMRDGRRLFTAVYTPNEVSKRWPILLLRTPYGVDPYGADRYASALGPSPEFEEEGFIFVFQDVRGRFMSEGIFEHMRPQHGGKRKKNEVDESTDAWDTVDWLVKNLPRNNGRVGMWGISYPGFYCSAALIGSHKALKAVSPQAPIADWYWDDAHHNGAYILPMTFFFQAVQKKRAGLTTKWPDPFDFGTTDGYRFYMDLGPLKNVNKRYFKGEVEFWNQIVAHPDYDSFWQARSIIPHLKKVKAAVLVVGGWFDSEDLYGPLATYKAIEKNNPRARNSLVMGPWIHGGWERTKGDRVGDLSFGFPTSAPFEAEVVLPFFLHHLKKARDPGLPEAYVFETGANRWRRFDSWPPRAAKLRRIYLREAGNLAFEPPPDKTEEAAHDAFLSDPGKPVPYTPRMTPYWSKTFLAEDQRFAAMRPDVLVYETPPLEEDLTFAGPVRARLKVSTTGRDADWVVKLVDVWPGELPGKPKSPHPWRDPPDLGGRQTLVRAEVLRGRYRNGFEKPEPFVPGEVTDVTVELLDVLHTFKRGHRIMVQVQSSWFPYVDRNPQSWVENIFKAKEEDFVKATHRVYRSAVYPSQIEVGELTQ